MNVFPRPLRSRPTTGAAALLALVLCVLLGANSTTTPSAAPTAAPANDPGLAPTPHPPLSGAWGDLWLVPMPGDAASPAARRVAEASRRLAAGDAAGALSALGQPGTGDAVVAGYAHLTAGRALRQLQRLDEARARFEAASAAAGSSALNTQALMALGELAEASAKPARAAELYAQVAQLNPGAMDTVQAALLRAATAAGDTARARAAASRLYYDLAASPLSSDGAALMAAERAAAPADLAAALNARELERADRLYEARRYAEARQAYAGVAPLLSGEGAERAAVRTGASDFHLAQHRAAVATLQSRLDGGTYADEARYYHLRALRALGESDRYVSLVQQLADRHPASPWAAEALNHLASYFIIDDQDDRAMEAFERLLRQHPRHRHAERAAWRLGWWHYRQGRPADAVAIFEQGAANAPRSDYRPSWLYWSGRGRERTGDREGALARYRVTLADYKNSYYGRLAQEALARLGDKGTAATASAAGAAAAAPRAGSPPSQAVPAAHQQAIRTLLAGGLYDFAAAEVEFAQRTWGSSPALEATLAWIYNQRGELRRGITAMRRAYPQFMAAGGEQLPEAMLQVIFPVAYGGLIERYARQRNLDPFLVAALVAQESTFQADARSVANALGLMQILPSTGRRLARTEGIGRFTAARLVDPELNVRLGTRYFAGLVGQLGGEHLALASYNAGKSRVDRWLAERPGVPRDEFIDDIPFPETQNYVKRILGTAEDYRRLYGAVGLSAAAAAPRATPRVVPARSQTPAAATTKKAAPAARKKSVKAPAGRSSSTTKASAGAKKKPAKKRAPARPSKVSWSPAAGERYPA